MDILIWVLTGILSFLLGVFFVVYLTVHPLRMSRYLSLTWLTLFTLLAAVVTGFEGTGVLLASLVALIGFVAGYLYTTQQVLARDDPRPVPELKRNKDDPGDGHTAIVYFTHGEPETYDPIGWINQFKEFDEQNIPFIPLWARPLFIYQLRQKYLQVGKSDHRHMHFRMLKSLEKEFRLAGDDTTKFYLCFLDDHPRPDAAVVQALNEGASRIIVSEVFLTISNHTAEGKALIEALRVEDYGVPIVYTGPLWDSRTLQSMFVQRVNNHLGGTAKSKVGVLLVGHGQPDEWDEEFPTETEQEILFREEILKLLETDGYCQENLSLAWMEFKEPKPAQKVAEFVANGVEKILFFAAAISADSIHSQYDIPALVHKAEVPTDVPILNLGAWNDDPIVINAIKEKIDRCLADFGSLHRPEREPVRAGALAAILS